MITPTNRILLFLMVFGCFNELKGEGIPEPPLVLYGSIVDNRNNGSILQTNGTLRIVLGSTINEEIVFSTELQNVAGTFSYILMLPAETPMVGLAESTNYLKFKSPPVVYTVKGFFLNGQSLFLEKPSSGQWEMNPGVRGSLRLVNGLFSPASVFADQDGDGLPDDWELRYFGSTTAANPQDDPDRDGLTNLQEYQQGTDPKDATILEFSIVSLSPKKIRLSWDIKPGKNMQLA